MYKVVLVDDEKQIIDGLCKMIRWSELGYEVIATARNGVEAIPLIRELQPDLVVTDVRMPEMDGLKMLEMVRRHISQDVEFIILSGFSDFQYARTAMQHNVKSYILKPIDESELYGALLDIKALLDEKEIHRSIQIRSYINGILTGNNAETGEAFPAGEERQGLRCIAVERQAQHAQADAQGCDLAKTIERLIGEQNMRFVLQQDGNRCLIVAGQSLLGSFGNDPRRLARTLHEGLWKAGIRCDILVGLRVAGCRNLPESVQSLTQCRNKLFYLDNSSVVVYDDIREEQFCRVYQDNGMVIRIISAFRKNDMEKLKSSFEQMVEHFRSIQVAPEVAIVHLDSAMAAVLQILSERREDVGEVLERYAAIKNVQSRMNIQNLARLAVQFCMACNELSLNGRKDEPGDIVSRVARYVEENYAKPLKINEIAERFYVNPAYLGQQFAKKKGCTLNHYINTVRMERAKELLANTSRRIYEVALETGYDDPNYFSSKFFEFTGRTPSEYRNAPAK